MANIWETIGDFFENLFKSKVEKIYDHLDDETKIALQNASAIIDTINKNIQATPTELLALVQQVVPQLNIDELKTGLAQLAAESNIAAEAEDSIEAILEAIRDYLAGKEGKFWEAASSTLSQILAIAFAPETTIFAKVVSVIEYVYREFIKKK